MVKTKVVSALGDIRVIASLANAYRADNALILQSQDLTETAKNERTEKLRTQYTANLKTQKDLLTASIAEIAEVVNKEAESLDMCDASLQTAVAAITAAEGAIPYATIESLVKNFAGEYQKLCILQAALKRYKVDVDEIFEKNGINAVADLGSIERAASDIDESPDTAIHGLAELFRSILAFAEKNGINLSEAEQDPGAALEEAQEWAIRQAMGL